MTVARAHAHGIGIGKGEPGFMQAGQSVYRQAGDVAVHQGPALAAVIKLAFAVAHCRGPGLVVRIRIAAGMAFRVPHALKVEVLHRHSGG